MPNHGSGVKTDFPAALGQTPAEIDVVSRGAEYRIEAAHGQQCILSEGAVAARNVLGFASGNQNMHRASRRMPHTFRDTTVSGRRNVRAADAYIVGGQEGPSQVLKPVRIWICIIVYVSYDASVGRVHPG